ncbi:MAG: glycosyltransferase family 1 protein, partial [Actinomyces sp.]|nr:glycosyltransferase family 1 protein [Actinomyces sp.]
MGMIVAHSVSHSHPIRVLLDGTAIPANLGGVGRYVDDLVPELVEQGVDLTMAVQERDAEHFATRLPSARIIPISRRFESRPARMAWEQTGLPTLIRK